MVDWYGGYYYLFAGFWQRGCPNFRHSRQGCFLMSWWCGLNFRLLFWLCFQIKSRSMDFYSPLFFTPLRTLLSSVRPVFILTSNGIWHRFSNNFCLACHHLQPLWEVQKPKLTSSLMFKSSLCHILVIHLQQGSLALTHKFKSCQDGRE